MGGVPVGRDPGWKEFHGRSPWLGEIPVGRSSMGGIPVGRSSMGGIPVRRDPGWEEFHGRSQRSGGIPVGRSSMETFCTPHAQCTQRPSNNITIGLGGIPFREEFYGRSPGREGSRLGGVLWEE